MGVLRNGKYYPDEKAGGTKLPPLAKQTQTDAFVTHLKYNPYINGARKAPANAPHEIPISCAINVGG